MLIQLNVENGDMLLSVHVRGGLCTRLTGQ